MVLLSWIPDLASVSIVDKLVFALLLVRLDFDMPLLPKEEPNWLGLKYLWKKTFKDGAEAQMIPKLASMHVVT
jgi:hypothetical protein